MSRHRNSSKSHPASEVLALYSRGDLPLLSALRARAHVSRCAECQHQIALFGSAAAELRHEAASQTLTAFEAIADWNRLEREMLGNIVVGVAAARCIENVGRKRVWITRLAMGVGLIALFAGGWFTHIPQRETDRLVSTLAHFAAADKPRRVENVVRTTSNGIAVRSDGVTLTILHPNSAVVAVSGNSSVEARYVDEDTGQLTITSVYGQ